MQSLQEIASQTLPMTFPSSLHVLHMLSLHSHDFQRIGGGTGAVMEFVIEGQTADGDRVVKMVVLNFRVELFQIRHTQIVYVAFCNTTVLFENLNDKENKHKTSEFL